MIPHSASAQMRKPPPRNSKARNGSLPGGRDVSKPLGPSNGCDIGALSEKGDLSHGYATNFDKKDQTSLPNEQRLKNIEDALNAEVAEKQQLAQRLRDMEANCVRAVEMQSVLENESIRKSNMIDRLEADLKLTKHQLHQVESELADQTAESINVQSKWLDSMAQLNDEISELKQSHKDTDDRLRAALKRAEKAESKAVSSGSMHEMKPIKANNVKASADELERHQNALVVKELLNRHQQLQDEIAETKEVNSRLQLENENFQLLLAQRTVSGGFTLAEDWNDSSNDELSEPETHNDTSSSTIGNNGNTSQQEYSCPASPAGKSSDEQAPNPTDMPLSAQSNSGVTSSDHGAQELQKLRFEVSSLSNYNRALRISLERLVHRLLYDNNGAFSKAIEESMPSQSIRQFSRRVLSSSDHISKDYARADSYQSPKHKVPRNDQDAAAILSQMMLNSHYTGSPTRRVISMGIDDEVKTPALPPRRSSRLSPSPTDSPYARPIGIGIFQSPSRRSSSPFQSPKADLQFTSQLHQNQFGIFTEDDGVIQIPKRTDHQTHLRKLYLRD